MAWLSNVGRSSLCSGNFCLAAGSTACRVALGLSGKTLVLTQQKPDRHGGEGQTGGPARGHRFLQDQEAYYYGYDD